MAGRVAARQQVASFFAPPNVAGLNSVWKGPRRSVRPVDYFTGTTSQFSGAVGWPYIEAQHDTRIALTGNPIVGQPDGKFVIYEVAFSIRFISNRAKSEDALDDHDAIIDAFTTRLRSDRTLGNYFWQAGEGEGGPLGTDIHVVSGPGPKQRKNASMTVIWSMIRFVCIEYI